MTALFFLVLIAVALLPAAYLAVRRSRRDEKPGSRSTAWVALVVAGIFPFFLSLILLRMGPGELGGFMRVVIPVVALVGMAMLFMVWVRELVTLMGMTDDAFPGRYDKALWFSLLVLLPPIGLLAFSIFRRAYWAAHKPTGDPAHELV